MNSPRLRYDYSALEPHYSARVLELHHDKHHKAYVDGVNTTLEKLAGARDSGDLSSIVGLEKTLAFNLSGHVLHTLFWKNLSPARRRQARRRARGRDRRVLRRLRRVPQAPHAGRGDGARFGLGRAHVGTAR